MSDVIEEEEYTYVLQPGAVVGGFRVVRPLGHGGLGEVYEAISRVDRRVALKILLPDAARKGSAVGRFKQEGTLMGRLRNSGSRAHPFPEVHDAELDSVHGLHYLALEFFDGKVLEGILAAAPGYKLDVRRAIDLVCQTLAAVGAMHALGIVHRDLKPDNLMVVEEEGAERIKVLDLGIAKAKDAETKTETGMVLGTPYYMPPEQCSGDAKIDHRADLYALGVILFECIGGFKPYERESFTALLSHICCGEPTELPADVDPRLREIVLKAISKKPDDRFQSAEEFRKALLDFVQPQTTAHAVTVSDGSKVALAHVTIAPVVGTRPPPMPTAGEFGGVTTDTGEYGKRRRIPTLAIIAGIAATSVAIIIALAFGGSKSPTRVATRPAPPPTTLVRALPAPVPIPAPEPPPPTPARVTAPAPLGPADTPHDPPRRGRRGARTHRTTTSPYGGARCADERYTYRDNQCCRRRSSGAIDCDGVVVP